MGTYIVERRDDNAVSTLQSLLLEPSSDLADNRPPCPRGDVAFRVSRIDVDLEQLASVSTIVEPDALACRVHILDCQIAKIICPLLEYASASLRGKA